MAELYVIRNQLGHYWGKSKAWVDGSDARAVKRTTHRDDAVNTLFELSSKDFELRGEVLEVETDEHLWAEVYDRDLKDIFEVQSDVAQQIAAALQATLSPTEKARIERQPTKNLTAYDYYLKGRENYLCLYR